MRVAFLSIIIVFSSLVGLAQEPKEKTVDIKVEGICGMCKDRIEELANLSKGVVNSSWNQETLTLTVTYKTKKTNPATIGQSLADGGHDNQYAKASDKAYSKIHKCCRYRDMEGH